jgi:hypothetical protein
LLLLFAVISSLAPLQSTFKPFRSMARCLCAAVAANVTNAVYTPALTIHWNEMVGYKGTRSPSGGPKNTCRAPDMQRTSTSTHIVRTYHDFRLLPRKCEVTARHSVETKGEPLGHPLGYVPFDLRVLPLQYHLIETVSCKVS